MLIGREAELNTLREALGRAELGEGSAILISGESGIGKTALVEAFKEYAGTQNVKVLAGAASADSAQPFLVFSKALEGITDSPLFEEQEYTHFLKIFAINHAGILVAQASSEETEMDADIFAGMLSAVQNFVTDSLGRDQRDAEGLGRLEYGDMKILIEHGKHLFLTGICPDVEHPDMKTSLGRALAGIEKAHGGTLTAWSGKVSDAEPIREGIARLAEARFPVRRSLEGVKLENERVRIADRLLETLVNIAEERPVALVLEDLHWADESSLFMLGYLARNVMTGKLMILCSARAEGGASKDAMDRIMAEGTIRSLELRKLEMNNISGLVNQLYNNNHFPESFIHNLSLKSAGNPFFLIELLRQMVREGNIMKRDGKFLLINEDFNIPSSVETVVQKRLDALEPDSLALAEYASCIGREFDADMAMKLVSLKDAKGAYSSLQDFGIVRARNGRGKFSHALFQEIIYNGISDKWRALHHRSLGEHLESAYGEDQESVLYDLARHFSRANVPEKAHMYCIRAGERAEGAYAAEMAVKFYREGLLATDRIRSLHDHAINRLEILEKLGDLHSFLGEYPSALEEYTEALALSETVTTSIRLYRKKADTLDSTGEYESALAMIQEGKDRSADSANLEMGQLILSEARIFQNRGDFEKGIALCNEALAIFRGCDSKVDIGNTMRLLGDMNHKMGRFSEALSMYTGGLDYLDREKNEGDYIQSEVSIGVLHADRGEYGRALEYLLRSKEALERKNDKKALANIQNSIGAVYWLLGENEKARDNFVMTLIKLERMGQKKGIALLLNNIGATHIANGELAKALEYYKRSLEIRRKIGDKSGIVQSLSNLGGLLFDMGSINEALADLKECEETAREINDEFTLATCLLNIADIRTFMGEHNAACKLLDESLELFIKVGDLTTVVNVYACFTNCYLGMGENVKALESAKLALDSAMALEVETKSQIALGRLALGRAKSATGDTKSARNELDKAIEICAQIQDIGMQAKAMLDKGMVLQVEGDIGNAKAIISDARERFEKMGMHPWAERCRKALEGLEK